MLRKHCLIARLLYKNVYLHEHTCTLHNSYHYNLFLLLLSILGDTNHHRYMAATNIIYIKKFKKTYRPKTIFILNRNTSEIQANSESKKSRINFIISIRNIITFARWLITDRSMMQRTNLHNRWSKYLTSLHHLKVCLMHSRVHI